jgi:aspartyl-tRNA(Asn)/glutamyl-tRNA(Gln) amidotransferase subunit A
LEVIAGADEYDSTLSDLPVPAYSKEIEGEVPDRKLAYVRQALEHPSLDPAIRNSLYSFFDLLRSEGYQVEPVELELLDEIVPAYYILTTAEASSNLSRYDGVRYGFRAPGDLSTPEEMYTRTRSQGFGKEVQRRILLGNFVLSAGYFDAYFTKAQQVRRMLSDASRTIFSQYSGLLLPTVPSPAFRLGEKNTDPVAMYLGDIYTVLANLVGSPAISLPLFRHPEGLPFGLQLMTARFNEVSLLRLSDRFLQLAEKSVNP